MLAYISCVKMVSTLACGMALIEDKNTALWLWFTATFNNSVTGYLLWREKENLKENGQILLNPKPNKLKGKGREGTNGA